MKKIKKTFGKLKTYQKGAIIGIILALLMFILFNYILDEIGLLFLFTIGLPFYVGGIMGALFFSCQEMTCLPYSSIFGIVIYVILISLMYVLIKKSWKKSKNEK